MIGKELNEGCLMLLNRVWWPAHAEDSALAEGDA